MQRYRALRATAVIIFGWVGLRTSFLLMSSTAETSAPSTRQYETALPITASAGYNSAIIPPAVMLRTVRIAKILSDKTKSKVRVTVTETSKKNVTESSAAHRPVFAHTGAPTQTFLPMPPRLVDTPSNSAPHSRRFPDLNISAWAILRPAGLGSNLATNGQLGASQAGVRVQQPLLHIGQRLPIVFNLRVSAPLDQKLGREAGFGLGTRPVKQVPIELILERRVALDRGGRNAFAVIAAGGFNDKRIVSTVSLSGYAQTGIVGFARGDGFVDGALQIERALLDRNHTVVHLGAGFWGAAQPGVARIDVGPVLAVKQRLGAASLRISAEYRWRIAGQARPASGPALSIGTNF